MAYNVRFLQGSQTNFDALKEAGSLNKNTFYYVNEKDLYLGEIKLSNDADIKDAVSRIAVNESEIADIKAELDALVDPEGTGSGSITTQIATLRNELLELINANSTAIEAEETRATKAEAALETKINGVSQTATDAIAMAGENQTAIGTINEKIAGLDELETAVESHTTAIETLVGEDEGLSARAIALQELTKQLVPETAQESMDTLAEIAAWIQAHPADASAMNAAIEKNAKDITSLTSLLDGTNTTVASLSELLTAVDELAKDNQNDISSMQDLLSAITNETSGILATAKGYTNEEIEKLALGSASKMDASAFEAAGSANAALQEAKAYTDESLSGALTWGSIVTE